MRARDWTWAYWALFGLGLATGSAIVGIVVVRLQRAFESDGLTRLVLVDALTLGLGALAMLLVSGWAFASRPARRAPEPTESLWD